MRTHLLSPLLLTGEDLIILGFYRDSIVTKKEGSLEFGVPDGI